MRADTGGVPLRTTVLNGQSEFPHGDVLLRLELHEQPLTAAVLPDHRRHGLARLVKAANTLALHDRHPQTEAVTVTVNETNVAMLAVNRSVGYTWRRTRLLVQL